MVIERREGRVDPPVDRYGRMDSTLPNLEGHVLRQYLETNGAWKWKQDYIWGPAGLLATVSPTEGTKHYVNDHLGSPRLICDRGAHTLAKHNYYPYGEESTFADLDRERIKFTGHERDLGLNGQTTDDLDYMHARHYSLHLGRFLSVDPIGGSIGSSQSWNRYAYVRGNPLRMVDPLGLSDRDINGTTKGCDQDSAGGDKPCTHPRPPSEYNVSGSPARRRGGDFGAELRGAIVQTIVLSLSVVPSGPTPVHSVLRKPLRMALESQLGVWKGHPELQDSMTVARVVGFMAGSIRWIQGSMAVIGEQMSIQADIAALGGVSEPVAAGLLGSGLTAGPALILGGGALYGGWQLGSVVRRHLPATWNEAMGDALRSTLNSRLAGLPGGVILPPEYWNAVP